MRIPIPCWALCPQHLEVRCMLPSGHPGSHRGTVSDGWVNAGTLTWAREGDRP